MYGLLLKWGLSAVLAAGIPLAAYWRGRTAGWEQRDTIAVAQDQKRLIAAQEQVLLQNRDDLRRHERFAALSSAAQKEKENANRAVALWRAAVADGSVRVSIPVVSSGAAGSDPAAGAPSGPGETRAELDPAAAAALAQLAQEGDDAIRDLNLCIDKYKDRR